MKLDEIFGEGHHVAFTPGPMRHIVNCPKPPAEEAALWLVSEDAIESVAYRKKVETEDLAGTVSDEDKGSDVWNVDDALCWCEDCSSSRKMLETQCD